MDEEKENDCLACEAALEWAKTAAVILTPAAAAQLESEAREPTPLPESALEAVRKARQVVKRV